MRRLAVPLLLLFTLAACDEWEQAFRPKGEVQEKLPAAHTALPDSACRVRWDGHTVPREMNANEERIVRVTFTNLGTEVWPDAAAGDPAKRDGGYAVRMGCQWIDTADPSRRPSRRIDLPRPLGPGETMTLLFTLQAPAQPGEHRFECTLVQELVEWFDIRGAQKLVIPVTVK